MGTLIVPKAKRPHCKVVQPYPFHRKMKVETFDTESSLSRAVSSAAGLQWIKHDAGGKKIAKMIHDEMSGFCNRREMERAVKAQ